MSILKYPQYVNSDSKQIGMFPLHWKCLPFKRLILQNDSGVWGEDPIDDEGSFVLRSTEQSVDGHWIIEAPARRILSSIEISSSLLCEGDLLITKSSGSSLHIGKTTLVTKEIARMNFCFGNFMQRIRLTSQLYPKLAWYLMNNEIARIQLDQNSNSTTGLANLNASIIGGIYLPIPPKNEQRQIIIFLDHETAKIDALIAEQQRLIELLKEKRQAVISHVVTKGLDPTATMKDSGIEWLGKVPAHWNISELKHVVDPRSSITYGIVQAGPEIPDGIPYIRTGDMSGSEIILETLAHTSPEIDAAYARSRVAPGDIVIAIRATIGKALLVPDELVFANLTQGTAKISPGHGYLKEFLLYAISAEYVQSYFDYMSKGATFKEITLDALRRTPITTPPEQEQREILKYLSTQLSSLEDLIEQAQQSKYLLSERRSALISAAVTGKIDVRNWQPPTNDTAFDSDVLEADKEVNV